MIIERGAKFGMDYIPNLNSVMSELHHSNVGERHLFHERDEMIHYMVWSSPSNLKSDLISFCKDAFHDMLSVACNFDVLRKIREKNPDFSPPTLEKFKEVQELLKKTIDQFFEQLKKSDKMIRTSIYDVVNGALEKSLGQLALEWRYKLISVIQERIEMAHVAQISDMKFESLKLSFDRKTKHMESLIAKFTTPTWISNIAIRMSWIPSEFLERLRKIERITMRDFNKIIWFYCEFQYLFN